MDNTRLEVAGTAGKRGLFAGVGRGAWKACGIENLFPAIVQDVVSQEVSATAFTVSKALI